MTTFTENRNPAKCILLIIILWMLIPPIVRAEADPENTSSSDIRYSEHFSADLRILTYGVIQEPSESTQNPNNNLINIPQYVADLEVRPDIRFNSRFFDAFAKPRAKLDFRSWEEGNLSKETQWDDDWYVNEWMVRFKAGERVFISYGRENLQWGPSFFYSPSNPFFSDNGRSNPFMEIPGMDFGRLVIVLHPLWTMSFIVNTDEGRNVLLGPGKFENTYAVKIDFTGRQNYASIIVSDKDNQDCNTVVGFFGGWTVSDAVILYGEGNLTKGNRALYPQRDFSLMGISMVQAHKNDSDFKPVLLVGGSYTFENSGTLTLEYMHNGPGYDNKDADLYYSLRQDGADLFNMGGIIGLFGASVLSQTGNTGLRFLRKNYAMIQYYQGNIKNRVDMTLRWTQNIDDGSGQFLGLLSVSLGNHFEIFSSGVINAGKGDTEFGSILNYQAMLGLKFTL